jgi:hypothetical protein
MGSVRIGDARGANARVRLGFAVVMATPSAAVGILFLLRSSDHPSPKTSWRKTAGLGCAPGVLVGMELSQIDAAPLMLTPAIGGPGDTRAPGDTSSLLNFGEWELTP